MNKRQHKKENKRKEMLLEIWGYDMSYQEKKVMERQYHEEVIVKDYRHIDYTEELEELSSILGIPYKVEKINYKYPNRMRFRALNKILDCKGKMMKGSVVIR